MAEERAASGGPRGTVVLVNGLPGSGKTTIGRLLAERCGWAFVGKDVFKEIIFDTLGWSDKEWSLRVSAASHRIIDAVVGEHLRTGHSVIVESNFKVELDSTRFQGIAAEHDARLVQVLCSADGDVLWDRYWARQRTHRHPGHVESETPEEQRRALASGRAEPLEVDGPVIEVDTTDFAGIDFDALTAAICGTGG